eukprot:Clim_evm23s161 gene=Clim_evmTU23s161
MNSDIKEREAQIEAELQAAKAKRAAEREQRRKEREARLASIDAELDLKRAPRTRQSAAVSVIRKVDVGLEKKVICAAAVSVPTSTVESKTKNGSVETAEKAEAEVKAKAEAEAKAKAEAEAQAKAEAEAQAKAEAEAQAKAEAEAQTKAVDEIKSKNKEDSQARAETSATAKTEPEAQAEEEDRAHSEQQQERSAAKAVDRGSIERPEGGKADTSSINDILNRHAKHRTSMNSLRSSMASLQNLCADFTPSTSMNNLAKDNEDAEEENEEEVPLPEKDQKTQPESEFEPVEKTSVPESKPEPVQAAQSIEKVPKESESEDIDEWERNFRERLEKRRIEKERQARIKAGLEPADSGSNISDSGQMTPKQSTPMSSTSSLFANKQVRHSVADLRSKHEQTTAPVEKFGQSMLKKTPATKSAKHLGSRFERPKNEESRLERPQLKKVSAAVPISNTRKAFESKETSPARAVQLRKTEPKFASTPVLTAAPAQKVELRKTETSTGGKPKPQPVKEEEPKNSQPEDIDEWERDFRERMEKRRLEKEKLARIKAGLEPDDGTLASQVSAAQSPVSKPNHDWRANVTAAKKSTGPTARATAAPTGTDFRSQLKKTSPVPQKAVAESCPDLTGFTKPSQAKKHNRGLSSCNFTAGNGQGGAILRWAQNMTMGYSGVEIENFSESFADGKAFLAIASSLFRNKIKYERDVTEDALKNCKLAFDTAEAVADVPVLLDPADFAQGLLPDSRSVMTYLSMLYRAMR